MRPIRRWSLAGVLAIAVGLSVGVPGAYAATGAPAQTSVVAVAGSPGASAVVTRTGLVHSQAGGCLAASKLAWRAPVIVTVCQPGRQSDTWRVRTVGGRAQICIESTFMCLDHNRGAAILLSIYAVGAWIVYHQYGRWVTLVEGPLQLTANGYNRPVSWWNGYTANAGRQLTGLP